MQMGNILKEAHPTFQIRDDMKASGRQSPHHLCVNIGLY